MIILFVILLLALSAGVVAAAWATGPRRGPDDAGQTDDTNRTTDNRETDT